MAPSDYQTFLQSNVQHTVHRLITPFDCQEALEIPRLLAYI